MRAKLTVSIDDQLIDSAKKHAAEKGISLSQLIANYFALLEAAPKKTKHQPQLGPLTTQLKGSLKKCKLTEDDYHRYLEEKYL